MNVEDSDNVRDQKDASERDNAEMYQHIKEAKEQTKQVN